VHDCLVDSWASFNVIPCSVCKKLNTESKISSMKIVQLDSSSVKVLKELKNVFIRLSSNPKFHQRIGIIIVDILEAYCLLLSRDCSEKLHGHFSTDRSHLWLYFNVRPNQIKIE
jgi:hypothetical protein